MEKTAEIIASEGGRNIYIETSTTPHYQPTRAFYERCGCQLVATLDDFYKARRWQGNLLQEGINRSFSRTRLRPRVLHLSPTSRKGPPCIRNSRQLLFVNNPWHLSLVHFHKLNVVM